MHWGTKNNLLFKRYKDTKLFLYYKLYVKKVPFFLYKWKIVVNLCHGERGLLFEWIGYRRCHRPLQLNCNRKMCKKCNGTGFIRFQKKNIRTGVLEWIKTYCSCPIGQAAKKEMFGGG